MSSVYATMPFLAAAATQGSGHIGIADAPGIPWLRIMFALLFCIALAVGAIFAVRTYQSRGFSTGLLTRLRQVSGAPEIEIVETRRASMQGHICLFHCRGSAYLVAITAGGTTLIDKMPVPPEDAAS